MFNCSIDLCFLFGVWTLKFSWISWIYLYFWSLKVFSFNFEKNNNFTFFLQRGGKLIESKETNENQDESKMSVQEIIQKRRRETMKQQGLELVQVLRVSYRDNHYIISFLFS